MFARNVDQDIDRGPVILGIAIASLVAALLCLALRLYIRLRMTRAFWWDDVLLIVGALFSIVGVVFNVLMVSYGAGRHSYYLSKEQTATVLKYNTLFAIMNVACVCLVKTSILIFALRLQASQKVARFIYVLLALTVSVGLGTWLLMWLQCIPFNALWNHRVKGKCISRETYGDVSIFQGVTYSALDLLISTLPAMILWNVQMKRRTKFAICFLMSLGLLATAFMIMRVVYHKQLAAEDFTFDLWGVDISAQLEQNVCIVAASVPTFPHLFKVWLRKFRGTISSESTKKSSSYDLRSLQKVGKGRPGNKHPYDDITDMSNITVHHDIEQHSDARSIPERQPPFGIPPLIESEAFHQPGQKST